MALKTCKLHEFEPFLKNLPKLIEMHIYPISTMDLVDMM